MLSMRLFVALVLAAPVLGGLTAALARTERSARRRAGAGVVIGLGAAVALTGRALDDAGGTAIRAGSDPVLVADRLGAVLAVFVLAMTGLVLAYAARYLTCDLSARRFTVGAPLLAAATVAVGLAADLWVLAGAWALVSLATTAVVRHDGRPEARSAARRAARGFAVGDLALFGAAVAATAAWGGRLPLAEEAQSAVLAADSGSAGLVAALAVIAAVTRGALLPAHRWLAGTLHTPTPVSALLHAGVVNGGGILLIRLAPTLRESTAATAFAVGVGAASMIVGVAASRTRADVKGALVWSTTGQMGFMVVQAALGLVGPALVHLIAHGMYKSNLFLGAGAAVDRSVLRRVHHRVRPVHAAVGVVVATAAVGGALVVLDPPGATSGPGLAMAAFLGAALAVVAARLATARPPVLAALLVFLAALTGPLYLAVVTAVEDDLLGAPHLAAPGATAMAVVVVVASAAGWWFLCTGAGITSGLGRAAWTRVVALAHPVERARGPRKGAAAGRPAAAPALSATIPLPAPETTGTAWLAA